jgi:putative phosphonate metabolism protein
MHARHAVYWAPPAGSALARFGADWLGWDAEAARSCPVMALPGVAVEAVTAVPRRYGFHATLKAPFRLAPGETEAGLRAALAALAGGERAFALPRLELAEIGDFLALVPGAPCPRLDAVAAACVTRLDRFRAPMDAEERARRAAGLAPRQAALLERWGYPFVLEAFRFHLTLSGPLAPGERTRMRAALAPILAPILAEGQTFGEIALFAQPGDAPFRIVERFALDGWSG